MLFDVTTSFVIERNPPTSASKIVKFHCKVYSEERVLCWPLKFPRLGNQLLRAVETALHTESCFYFEDLVLILFGKSIKQQHYKLFAI